MVLILEWINLLISVFWFVVEGGEGGCLYRGFLVVLFFCCSRNRKLKVVVISKMIINSIKYNFLSLVFFCLVVIDEGYGCLVSIGVVKLEGV